MKDFFKVLDVDKVLEYRNLFSVVGSETVSVFKSLGRILAENIVSDMDLPDFHRSTMDGYAVKASSCFGASEANPAYLTIKGEIKMGCRPDFAIGIGEAAKISTGGMLPKGADSVVMIEYTQPLDDMSIEVYKSVAPGQNIIEAGEDFKKDEIVLKAGTRIRAQEMGLAAAFGRKNIKVFKRPSIGIISTGDEIVPIDEVPETGRIRDINSYSLWGMVEACGAVPVSYGIVKDDYDRLFETCKKAVQQTDMILISGGSSVGTRDFTIDVMSELSQSSILFHGISISPGKPTILSKVGKKAFWGLPGHVVSAMVVFTAIVKPFIEHISGFSDKREKIKIPARLTRNLASAQGRVDYVRVRLLKKKDGLWARPVLGKSGLINTMIKADGLIAIERDAEGLYKGDEIEVTRV